MPMTEEILTGGETVNLLRTLFHRSSREAALTANGGSRFDRYYGDVIRSGVGYPTADEARRDLARHDRSMLRYGWPR